MNTEPFLCHTRALRYLKTKCGSEVDKFKFILACSNTYGLRVASGYPKRSQTGTWLILSYSNWSNSLIFFFHFNCLSKPITQVQFCHRYLGYKNLYRISSVFNIFVWIWVSRRRKTVCTFVDWFTSYSNSLDKGEFGRFIWKAL